MPTHTKDHTSIDAKYTPPKKISNSPTLFSPGILKPRRRSVDISSDEGKFRMKSQMRLERAPSFPNRGLLATEVPFSAFGFDGNYDTMGL